MKLFWTLEAINLFNIIKLLLTVISAGKSFFNLLIGLYLINCNKVAPCYSWRQWKSRKDAISKPQISKLCLIFYIIISERAIDGQSMEKIRKHVDEINKQETISLSPSMIDIDIHHKYKRLAAVVSFKHRNKLQRKWFKSMNLCNPLLQCICMPYHHHHHHQ